MKPTLNRIIKNVILYELFIYLLRKALKYIFLYFNACVFLFPIAFIPFF
jgi:hypothetical protein